MSATLVSTENDRTITLTATVAGQTVFPFDFPAQSATDLRVEVALAATPTAFADLSYAGGAFAVTGLGIEAGGSVTLATGRAVGDKVRISGDTAISRSGSVVAAGRFSSDAIDTDLDRSRMIEAELRRDVDDVTGRVVGAETVAADVVRAEAARDEAEEARDEAVAAANAVASSDHRTILPEILGIVGLAPVLDYTTTVSAAIAVLKARALGEPLVINGGVRFNADITIDVPIVFAPGAYFTVTTGHTVTIANSIDASRQHIFRGAGSYVLGNVGTTGETARQVHAAWFGVFPYAGTNPVDQGPLIQAIATAMGNARESVIDFDVGNYTIQSQVLLTRCCWIRGQGSRRTVFRTTTDGFSLFKSTEVGAKVTDCQFEIASPLSSRDSPFVEFGHGECEAYNISAGNTKRSIVLSGSNARVRNITGAWGYSPGAGSSLVEVMGGSGHRISEILAPTSSAYGPEQLVLIGGPNQSATISGVTARDIAGISPSRSVAVVAQGGAISRVDIADIQSNAFAGTPPDVAVLFKTAGTYGLSDVTLRAFEINSFATAGIRVEQGSSGTTEDVAIDGGNVSGATGNGLEIVRTAGTLKQIKVGAGVDLSERATPVYRSGTSTEVIIAPEAMPSQLGSVCYDLGDIADDTAVSVDLGRVVFSGTVEISAGYVYWGDFVIRAASTPGVTKKNGHANVAGTAAVLSGTTGTDGNMTLGVQSGLLYVENRIGSTQRVQLILKTGIR